MATDVHKYILANRSDMLLAIRKCFFFVIDPTSTNSNALAVKPFCIPIPGTYYYYYYYITSFTSLDGA